MNKKGNWLTLQCVELIPPKYKTDHRIKSIQVIRKLKLNFTIKLESSLYIAHRKSQWDINAYNINVIIGELPRGSRLCLIALVKRFGVALLPRSHFPGFTQSFQVLGYAIIYFW